MRDEAPAAPDRVERRLVDAPFFSICIPQHNRTSFLIEVCRSLAAQLWNDKVVLLILVVNESKSVGAGDRFDCQSPIGAALGDGSGHGVMIAGLNGVAGRTSAG